MELDLEAHAKGIEYLQARGQDRKPFFLGVSYNYPHEPFWPPEEVWEPYRDADLPIPEFLAGYERTLSPMDKWLIRHHGADRHDVRNPQSLTKLHRAYYALVTWIDKRVGELLDSLQKSGLSENTNVVFLSDHGDMLGHKGMVQKRCFYEWSSRVRAMPDGKFAGRVVNEPVSLIDFAPTVNAPCGRRTQDRGAVHAWHKPARTHGGQDGTGARGLF